MQLTSYVWTHFHRVLLGDVDLQNAYGLILGAGKNNTSPLETTEANKNFIDLRFRTKATSGANRGIYLNFEFNAASTGDGEALRAYTKVTAALSGGQEVHGIHATAQIGLLGTISGAIASIRATIEAVADTRTLGGTGCALQVESNIAAGNTVPSSYSLIRLAKAGAVDVGYLFDISDDQILKGSAAGATNNAIKCRLPSGADCYIPLCPVS